jgi:hypothetical protein
VNQQHTIYYDKIQPFNLDKYDKDSHTHNPKHKSQSGQTDPKSGNGGVELAIVIGLWLVNS